MYICSGMYHLSFCRKRAAEQKIKNYFFQLTDGCGSHECKNEYCASSGRKQTSKDDAAALALQLFMKKARLCEPLQDKNHKGMIIQWFGKILRFSRKFKTWFFINLVLRELNKTTWTNFRKYSCTYFDNEALNCETNQIKLWCLLCTK